MSFVTAIQGTKEEFRDDGVDPSAANRSLVHRTVCFLRPQPTQERLRSGSHVQQHPRVWIQNPGAGAQRRNRCGRPLTNQGSAQAGIVARRRHDRNPGDPLRRVERCAGEGLPADGEPFGNLGGLGRRTTRPGVAGTQCSGIRSQPHRFRPERNSQPSPAT